MTLYKNLGPITFLQQTQAIQIFSGSNEILILQFKNQEQFNYDQICQILAVYNLILKQQHLLEIYSQKHKPSSIIIHNAVRVVFQKINVQLLCRIIKQMVTSIFHTQKVAHNKIGQITKEMFYYIDGELRYLYFPTRNVVHKPQEIISEVLQFLKSLKNQKQVSHRLLLKKISKCVSLQEILQQTDYFLNIYHSKQSHTTIIPQNALSQQNFIGRTIKNPKFLTQTTNQPSQNKFNQFRNLSPFSLNYDSNNGKNTTRRKYNLFKTVDSNSSRNTGTQNQFNSTTWRNTNKESVYQNSTMRNNSRAVHVDLSKRSIKNQSASLFNRASSLGQGSKRPSCTKKTLGNSLHTRHQNYLSLTNESFIKSKDCNLLKNKVVTNLNEKQQSSRLKESSVSKNLDQSVCLSKEDNSQRLENSQSSQWMKQMVNKSLDKWKQKSKQKVNIFTSITKDHDRDGSTQVDSRSKCLQNIQRQSFNTLANSNISSTSKNKYSSKVEETNNKFSQTQSRQHVGSEKKLKRGNINNRQNLHDNIKPQIQQKYTVPERNSQQLQFQYNNNLIEKQTKPVTAFQPVYKQDQSLEQIKLFHSSIEKLAVQNKQQQMKISRDMKKKESSIIQINQNNNTQKKLSDESETQRIQYSKIDLKHPNKKQNIQKNQTEIQELVNRLTQINHFKQQIDYIGVAVVQTTEHLKSFESIFWQLPMFFLYKKFYQKRLKLFQNINQLLSSINNQGKKFVQILAQVSKNCQEIKSQNLNIEQSLMKLLKTVKKKIKKQYPRKKEQQYVQKYLNLDFSIQYDHATDQFISMYLDSLLEAKCQYPELIFHVIDILEAVVVCKGKQIQPKDRQSFESSKTKLNKIEKAESYYTTLMQKNEIKSIFKVQEVKDKRKK